MDELVLTDIQIDLAEALAGKPPPHSAAAVAHKADSSEDDVVVIDDEAADEDDVVVVDDEPSADDVIVDNDEPSLPIAANGADPFEGLDVSDAIQQGIRAELAKGERIVWVGRPSMTLMLAKAAIARIAGVILVVLGLGLPAALAFASGGLALLVFFVFGLSFTAFGVVLLLAPQLVLRNAPARRVYVVTNRRALVNRRAPGSKGKGQTDSYTTGRLKKMQREDSARVEGAGDLIFETKTLGRPGQAASTTARPTGVNGLRLLRRNQGFLMLENVQSVEKLIRETLIDRGSDKALAQ
jgi:membrane protein implicated in regulation of membrane protease activity